MMIMMMMMMVKKKKEEKEKEKKAEQEERERERARAEPKLSVLDLGIRTYLNVMAVGAVLPPTAPRLPGSHHVAHILDA